MKNKILVTGAAGFIGFHLCNKLSAGNYEIIGLDNLNDYYDVTLKIDRLHEIGFEEKDFKYGNIYKSKKFSNLSFVKLNLEDKDNLHSLFAEEKFNYVINLAAQAGVRYSIENPYTYIESNINGFLNILEGCRNNPVKHLIFASSSSVYGANKISPFDENHPVDFPISLYAATKKSNELLAHSYSYLYNIPATGLRFFTVYGPWGRPDMAYFSFTKNILEGKPIKVYNNGKMKRDFTYIDDIVKSVVLLLEFPPESLNNEKYLTNAKYNIFNLGNNFPVDLEYFIKILEEEIGKSAIKQYLPLQAGDMLSTYANTDKLSGTINYKPQVKIEEGLRNFISWYKTYNGKN